MEQKTKSIKNITFFLIYSEIIIISIILNYNIFDN